MVLNEHEPANDDLLSKNVRRIFEARHLQERIISGEKLRVKFGVDPTAPDVHLGHTVALRKLKKFQERGDTIVLIIGDITARIGDPSGKSETRKHLTVEDVKHNFATYLDQVGRFLDVSKIEVRHNSEWYKEGGLELLIEILARVTVQQDLERADFQKRIKEGRELSMLEAVYPLLQGYDSVAIKADLEIGGNDQLFNMLMGRRLQRAFGLPEQDVMALELVEGLDGVKKMSKSYGNYIALTDAPKAMFGKVMSIPDALVEKYFYAFTDMSQENIRQYLDRVKNGNLHPRDAKMILAKTIVSELHGPEKAEAAEKYFVATFQNKNSAESAAEVAISRGITLIEFLKTIHGVKSNSEARRLIDGGGVRVNKDSITDESFTFVAEYVGAIVEVGKRHAYRIIRFL